MPRLLVFTGPNHNFDQCAPIVAEALAREPDLDVTLTPEKAILASPDLAEYDAVVLGTGFTRRGRQPDGSMKTVSELTDEQATGLFSFVRGGKGIVGVHGTGWWIGGEAVTLLGGHANWHPAGLEFSVHVEDRAHPIVSGIDDFSVEDEIYMSAWDPEIHVLASARWAERSHPVAWTHSYGRGRVFFTALGHGPSTFGKPSIQKLLANAARWVSGAG